MAKKMSDDDIRAYIDARVHKTLSTSDSELRGQREKALDFYYGRPLGNEIEGRAQVVSKDVMDTIEWMMPSLMRVFSMSESVQFDPVGPEDEALAKQETAYVGHTLWKKNNGFIIVHNSLKDGLMQKQGYVHYEWEDEQKVSYDEYEGLDDEQLALLDQELAAKGEVDVLEQKQDDNGMWHVKFRIKSNYGCAKVENIPPDDMVVDSECRGDVKLAKLAGHFRRITRSDLIQELGLTKEEAKKVKSYGRSNNFGEKLARDTVSESTDFSLEDNELDWASQEVEVFKCYTKLDVDMDGIAEMRTLLLHGDGILENKECREVQYCSFTPSIIPHRHTGLSVYDMMEDLQRIKTALQRGLLDNVYFTMNDRKAYDRNLVDVSMLQINRPGGHVAVNGPPQTAIMSMPVNPMAGQLLPVIDYFDTVKETRTGVGRITSGVDADVLAQSTKGAYVDAKSAANQRIEMIARIYAETFLAQLYQGLHRLLSHHQDWPTRFKLRNEWVTVNPTEWEDRTDMTVSVGLGNANREEVRNNLIFLGQAQERAAQMPGLIQPKNVFNLFNRVQSELGFDGAEFITDPSSKEYEQFMQQMSQNQGTDPYVQAEAMKSQTRLQEKQIDAAVKTRGQDQDLALGIAKIETDANVDIAKAGIGAELKSRTADQAGNRGPAAPQQ
jgi:hypothetical protein